MSRPRKCCKICNPPMMKGFKPYGINQCRKQSVILRLEEYESIRLINYESLSQESASMQMNISRPTFTRIYNRALQQIATSLIEGKILEIEGGHYMMDRDWYRCRKCNKLIDGLENHRRCNKCNDFGDNELESIGSKQPNVLNIKNL